MCPPGNFGGMSRARRRGGMTWRRGAESDLRARVEKMRIRTGTRELIVDGCWIVGGTATVRVQDQAQIHNVEDSAILDASAPWRAW